MIEEAYVSFETAKLLKEKGFDEPCYAYYEDNGYFLKSHSSNAIGNITNPCFFGVAASTQQMAMRWLREVHRVFIELTVGETNGKTWYDFDIIPINGREIAWNHYNSLPLVECNSYEEAVEAAIQYSLKNLI